MVGIMNLSTDAEINLNSIPITDVCIQSHCTAVQIATMSKLCNLYQAHIKLAEEYKAKNHNVGYDDHCYWAAKLKRCIDEELVRIAREQDRAKARRAIAQWCRKALFVWIAYQWNNVNKNQVAESTKVDLIRSDPEAVVVA